MLINLAYLIDRPTGTTAYALNLLPYLQPLSPTYLATAANGLTRGLASKLDRLSDRSNPSAAQSIAQYIEVPDNMTQGTSGHLRRLWWTQFQLARLCQRQGKATGSNLLFSPIPEAPLAIRRAHRCHSVVTFHDLIPLRFPELFGAIKYYYRYYVPQVLAQAEQVICNSEATARDVVDFYGISARKLVPIPLAHDAYHFRPTAAKPELPGEENLIAKPYFLMIGRHAFYKNISPVIAAMAHLPDCALLIAGPSDQRYTPKLKALAHELGIPYACQEVPPSPRPLSSPARIKFLDYVPYAQLPALLSHAIALVFPSLWEGFGLPVLEAMACGTPVITSQVASMPEVAGDAAYLIDPTNATAIGQAMQELIHDAQLRQQLSEAGQQRAKQFSWAKTGQATVEVLQRYL
jgi:glycosyltransferase involved in cell wall biosynthesis